MRKVFDKWNEWLPCLLFILSALTSEFWRAEDPTGTHTFISGYRLPSDWFNYLANSHVVLIMWATAFGIMFYRPAKIHKALFVTWVIYLILDFALFIYDCNTPDNQTYIYNICIAFNVGCVIFNSEKLKRKLRITEKQRNAAKY